MKALAEQGYAYAQFGLGAMHEHGRGVPQDDAKADYWYWKAEKQRRTKVVVPFQKN